MMLSNLLNYCNYMGTEETVLVNLVKCPTNIIYISQSLVMGK